MAKAGKENHMNKKLQKKTEEWMALSNEDQTSITLPTSRTLTKEKEKKVIGELNIHVKTQELAQKIVSYRKEKRIINKKIAGVEKELAELFDDAGIDCLEIEMGMLVRKKTKEGEEWMIEL